MLFSSALLESESVVWPSFSETLSLGMCLCLCVVSSIYHCLKTIFDNNKKKLLHASHV